MTQTDKITHAIVVNEIAKNANMWLRNTPYFKEILKNRLNQLLPELYKAQKDYDSFFNKVEESTEVVYQVYEDYTKAISSVPIWECENITKIIKAYNKDPKSIEGIVNKILNNVITETKLKRQREKKLLESKAPKMLEMLQSIIKEKELGIVKGIDTLRIKQLIKEATEL